MGTSFWTSRNVVFSVFHEVAAAFRAGELTESIQLPVLANAVALMGDIGEQYTRLAMHCVNARLDVSIGPPWVPEPDQGYIDAVLKTDVKMVAQRVSNFFKGAKVPPWVELLATAWQSAAKEKKEAKAAAATATAAAATADAEAHAVPAEAAATGAENPAATGAADTIDPWMYGMTVIVKSGSGANARDYTQAKVCSIHAKHCWVRLLEGKQKGNSKKILKANLTPVEPEPVALPEAETALEAEEVDKGNEDNASAPVAAVARRSGVRRTLQGDWEAWKAAQVADVFG